MMVVMPSELEDPTLTRVEFRSPLYQRIFRFIKIFFTTILLLMVLAVAWYGMCLLFWTQPPPSAFTGLPVVMLVFLFFIIWALDRHEPFRIIFSEFDLWIGGRFSGRRTTYENVRIVRQEVPDNSIGRLRSIVIDRHRGRALKIWLSANDAQQCFDALRQMCDHAPAIDQDDIHAPANPEHAAAAVEVLNADLRAKMRAALIGGTAAFVLGTVLFVGLLRNGGSVRAWTVCSFFLLGGGSALVTYVRNIYIARSLDDTLNDA